MRTDGDDDGHAVDPDYCPPGDAQQEADAAVVVAVWFGADAKASAEGRCSQQAPGGMTILVLTYGAMP